MASASSVSDLSLILDEIKVQSRNEVANRLDQYKNTSKSISSHEERRQNFLKDLKVKRQNYLALARNLALGDISKSGDLSDEDEEAEMEIETKPNQYRTNKTKSKTSIYKNQLMLSEWMIELPIDFELNFLMKLCPVSKRCLVIASNGETKVYARRNGDRVNAFPSLLPGGSREFIHRSSNFTILDCLYCLKQKSYFILDIMCWNGYPVYNSDTEFRFYWLKDKLAEIPNLNKKSSINWFPFLELCSYSCDKETLGSILNSTLPFKANLDGILFYHKRGHYTPGYSPLNLWLKPYMLSEVLSLSTPNSFYKDKPESYTSFESFAEKQMQNILLKEKIKCLKEDAMNID